MLKMEMMVRRKECKPNIVVNTYIRPSMVMHVANICSTLATVWLATIPVYGYKHTDYDRPPYNEEVSLVPVWVPVVSILYTYHMYTGTLSSHCITDPGQKLWEYIKSIILCTIGLK